MHGAIRQEGGWTTEMWRDDGSYRSVPEDQSRADLIEVLPEVTVRKVLVCKHDGRRFDQPWLLDSYDVSKIGRVELGTIDITHNGKEITKVEVVK